MNWDDLRLLLAVARRGSFLRAGEALGMAASTLSRRITQLEAGIMLAAFSAIIMVGALVLPEVMVGMTEAPIQTPR